jgi:hypothetical protein
MNTWTSKGLLPAVLCLVLAGCDAAGGLNFGAVSGAKGPAPFAFAPFADGAVTLVPPTGYCIDRRSLNKRFALMARCDMLGGDEGAGAPLAIITATAVPAPTTGALTPLDLQTGMETVLSRQNAENLSLVHVRGTPPIPDVRDVYWRGAGRIGDHIIGLAIYEAQDAPDLGPLAPELLKQTIRRTRDKTAAGQDNSATPDTIPD